MCCGQHNPLPTGRWRRPPPQVRAAADTPNTPNREGKSSQREHPCGRHQTIILPCVGANLSNGHKGTRVSSGYAARGGDRGGVSQVHGHNQALSSALFAFHELLRFGFQPIIATPIRFEPESAKISFCFSGDPFSNSNLAVCPTFRPLASHGTPWRYSKTARRCDPRRRG